MWRWMVTVPMALSLILAVAAVVLAVRMLRPELLLHQLRAEMRAAGPTVGKSAAADVVAQYGPPGRIRAERGATVYMYPAHGLLFRFSEPSGKLFWYEVTSPVAASGRNIRVGATLTEVTAAYGKPGAVRSFNEGSMVRYPFGTAYSLEFWLNRDERVDKIVFFRA